MISKTTKKYVLSSIITFLTAFSLAVLPHIDTVTPETVKAGALGGIIFAGVRAGIKAILEFAVNKE